MNANLKGKVQPMKKLIATVLFFIAFDFVHFGLQAQSLPWSDNFDYTSGNNLTAVSSDWLPFLPGNNEVKVSNGGLSYTNYPSSGIGKAIDLMPNQQSVFRRFSRQTAPATIYVSFLVKVSSASTSDVSFVSLAEPDNIGEPLTKYGLVYVKRDASGALFYGIGKTGSPQYTTSSYDSTQVQLVVMKYSMVTNNNNDELKLWVNPDLSGSEPTALVTITPNEIDPDSLRIVEVSGLPDAGSPTLVFDGIRVANSWSDAPLPVQLTAFTAVANRLSAELRWSTATEVNNHGFEIERRTVQRSEVGGQISAGEWARVGFVPGAGTSTSPKEYTFVDAGLEPGRYAYRIKQVDNDGAFTYYSAAEVEIGAAPKAFTLHPNYPNPFNPSTSIEFTIPEDGFATLKVFNLLGQEVATLFEGEAVAGQIYQRTFDASQLPTGVYVSRLTSGGRSLIQKMLLAK